jgi:hypothetical protein
MNDDSEHYPHAHEDIHNRHEGEREDQLNRDYDDPHDNEDNAGTYTPEMSSDEDDLAAILDLPPAKSKRGDIMDDNSEVASTMTKIEMMEDLIVMHEDVTTVNGQGLHTGVNKEDIFVKKELLANDTHLYDGKHVTIQVARPNAYEAASKTDVTNKTNPEEAIDETNLEEDVDKTHLEIDIENNSFMRAGTNKPTGTSTLDVKGLHTREEKDHFVREELPADNKVLAKYEYEGNAGVQDSVDVPNMPPKEELPADNKMVDKYGYSDSRIVMTSLMETLDFAKMLAYMDENYKITSQMGDENEPLLTWKERSPMYERTRTTSTRPTKRRTSPTMNRPTACLTKRSLEARHDRQRLRGASGGIAKCATCVPGNFAPVAIYGLPS